MRGKENKLGFQPEEQNKQIKTENIGFLFNHKAVKLLDIRCSNRVRKVHNSKKPCKDTTKP